MLKAGILLVAILINQHIISESSVVELGDNDFHSTIQGKNTLVMFYSPNCGHCMQLKPTYHALPVRQAISESDSIIAAVDCTVNSEVCRENKVNGYPTVKIFLKNGNIVDYTGNREIEDLEHFVLKNIRPALTEILPDKASEFIASSTLPVVVGYFNDARSKFFVKFQSLTETHKHNFIFGYTFSDDMTSSHSQTKESVVLYRQKHFKCPYEEHILIEKSEKQLEDFLLKNRLSSVDIRTPDNEYLFKTPLIVGFIPFNPIMRVSVYRRLRNPMLRKATEFPEISFAISVKSDYESFIEETGLTGNDVVHLILFNQGKKYACKDVISPEDNKHFAEILSKFISDFKKGNVLEQLIKSQPVPEQDEGFVKTVVAKNFEEIVMDPSKDVLIEFYAPWCGHCKQLAPTYEKLAQLLKDEDSLVIAKIDATANEVHPDFDVQGFPTIYLAPAGEGKSPIRFEGGRELSNFVDWLKEHTVNPIKYTGEIPQAKEEL